MKGVFSILAAVVIWPVVILVTAGGALIPFFAWLLLVFNGSDKRADKALATLKTTLMPDEQLLEQAVQHRAFALFSRRRLLAITNSRIITIDRGLLGGFKMADIQWKDLKDARIEQNVLGSICGSNMRFQHLDVGNTLFVINGVPSDVASKIYSKAQFEEQAWEEKRRIRKMEEVRAAAGGVYVATPNVPAQEPKQEAARNIMLEEIQKAKELLDMGAVTDSEFQEMKAKILAKS